MSTISNVGQSSAVSGVDSQSTSTAGGAGASSVMPEPTAFGGNTVTELAILMTKADEQDEQNASIQQDQADAAMAQDDANRVQAMRDKANQDLYQGLASGIADMAGGVLALAGACCEPSSATGSKAVPDALGAGGKMASALGPITSAPFKKNADNDDATAAQDQAAADTDKRSYDAAQSQAQSAQDSIQKVEQYLQAILQTQEATSLKAAGGAV
jgi:hypothetical protein